MIEPGWDIQTVLVIIGGLAATVGLWAAFVWVTGRR